MKYHSESNFRRWPYVFKSKLLDTRHIDKAPYLLDGSA
jgi:hypothetical protein